LSLLNNDEVNAVILSKEFALEMEKMFAGDLADSKQIHWVDWQKRPVLPKVREWFINLIFQWL
jgi:cardiolipin synthase